MNEKLKKAWVFVKEHEAEILVGTCAAAVVLGGVVLYGAERHKRIIMDLFGETLKTEKVFPDLGVGTCTDLYRFKNNNVVEIFVDDMKLEDIGALGEGITNAVTNLPENATVWTLVSIREGK